eukprot:CAMPEP_0176424982 /NCGR_PEP_ID=MMETSP0127-20121128/11145_1 /TAXON_ID=938130 /ORGANISM="Platyophrya macrostoma, Strain WH" /LENGTH=604 /DNA_ID=CAMNT_0017806111 /DNA_START=15 /DNA_END=1829 /DNA_ORIENTATION=+
MPIKVCYKNEIHRVSKTPQDFNSLLQALKEIFSKDIPEKFNLQYEDSEGDKIVLASNEDYKLALESEVSNSSRTLKIYLIEADEANNTSFITKNVLDQLEDSSLKSTEQKKTEVVPPAEKEEKISKAQAPEPTNRSFMQAVIEDPAICDQISKTFNQCYQKREMKWGRGCWGRNVEYSNVPCDCNNNTQCRLCNGTGLLKSRIVKKRERMQNMVRETLQQELPNIVQAVKELMQNPEKPVEKVLPKKVEEVKVEEPKPTENKAVHHRVECDVCGVCPIVGARYKCSVTDNYDLCEKCEAVVDHPYPLLKIKNESQHPVQVITILNEDAPQQNQHWGHHGPRRGHGHWGHGFGGRRCNPERMQERVQSFLSNIPGLSVDQRTNLNSMASTVINNISNAMQGNAQTNRTQQTQATQATMPQKKEEETPQGLEHDASFIRVLSTIPERIETKDLMIYKTVSVRNEGTKSWPKNAFIESEGEIVGETVKLPSIESGKEFTTVLIIRSPAQAGKFTSKWRFGYLDDKNHKKSFGKEFTVEFEVEGEKAEQQIPIEKTEKKQYSQEIMSKAEAIVEIFPQLAIEEVYEYIEQDPARTIEELMQEYIAMFD